MGLYVLTSKLIDHNAGHSSRRVHCGRGAFGSDRRTRSVSARLIAAARPMSLSHEITGIGRNFSNHPRVLPVCCWVRGRAWLTLLDTRWVPSFSVVSSFLVSGLINSSMLHVISSSKISVSAAIHPDGTSPLLSEIVLGVLTMIYCCGEVKPCLIITQLGLLRMVRPLSFMGAGVEGRGKRRWRTRFRLDVGRRGGGFTCKPVCFPLLFLLFLSLILAPLRRALWAGRSRGGLPQRSNLGRSCLASTCIFLG